MTRRAARTARCQIEEVGGVDRGVDGAVRVDINHTAGGGRSKPQREKVFLGAEGANGRIQRSLIVVTGEVAEDLRLAVAKRIDRNTEARRPVVGEGVVNIGSLPSATAPSDSPC